MRRHRTLAACLAAVAAALLSAGVASAQEAPPPPGPANEFTLPPVERFSLENGVEVRLVPYGDVPKVSARLVVQTGAVDEGPDEVWLARLTGEMMEQGTATRTAEEIALEAAGMGGSLELEAGVNQLTIGGTVLSEFGPEIVDLIADVARRPAFPEAELPRLKTDMLRDLAIERSDPDLLARARFLAVLYPGHPYGRIFPSQQMVEGYTIDHVRRFHERNVGASRAALYVAGRFDAAEVRAAIERALSSWEPGREPTTVVLSPTTERKVYLLDRPGAVQSTIWIGLPVVDPSQPDHLPLEVTNTLLGGYFGSRITLNLREDKGYTYTPFSSIASRLGTGFYVQSADVTTEVTGPSLREILHEIGRLRSGPPGEGEVGSARSYLAGAFVLDNASRAGIVDQLAFLDLHGLGDDYLRSYVQRVQSTTEADMQRLAQRYLDPERMVIVVVGDRSAILDQIRPYGEVVEEPAG
jgi:zinc protease